MSSTYQTFVTSGLNLSQIENSILKNNIPYALRKCTKNIHVSTLLSTKILKIVKIIHPLL